MTVLTYDQVALGVSVANGALREVGLFGPYFADLASHRDGTSVGMFHRANVVPPEVHEMLNKALVLAAFAMQGPDALVRCLGCGPLAGAQFTRGEPITVPPCLLAWQVLEGRRYCDVSARALGITP